MASTKILKLKQNWCVMCLKDKKKNPGGGKEKKWLKVGQLENIGPCWRIWFHLHKNLELEENFKWLYDFKAWLWLLATQPTTVEQDPKEGNCVKGWGTF